MAFLSHLHFYFHPLNFSAGLNRIRRFKMNVTIYGIIGQKTVNMPLDNLEIDDLDVGREFVFKGKVYEIRSITEQEDNFLINVVLIME